MTLPQDAADPGIDAKATDLKRPIERELRTWVSDGFSLALAGDCILSRPISQLTARVPGLGALVEILRSADASIGNLETSIFDPAAFVGHPYSWDGDWPVSGVPSCADDLVALGFDMMARANNHALDWGVEGMRETTRHIDRVGLVHAGTGDFLGRARAPRYLETAKGRVGLVSVVTTYRPTSEALDAFGTVNGRPGVNGLALRQVNVLPGLEFDTLRQMPGAVTMGENGLTLFGRTFERGTDWQYRFDMDPDDLAGILRCVRQGKQSADLMVVSVHAHEVLRDGYPELPALFLKDLARAMIDAGADAVVTSGIHHLGPMEIYRNRPVFYGLGNFIWSDIQEELPGELFRLNRDLLARSARHPGRVTAADLSALLNAGYFTSELVFERVVPVCRFSEDRLAEVTLYPVELGHGEALTGSGVPRLAHGAAAQRILRRLAEVSRTFGCGLDLSVVGDVGIVRL